MGQARHRSTANRHHHAAGLIVLPEIVLLGFAVDHVEEEAFQIFIRRAGAQNLHDVELEITPKTRPKLSVAGQAQFVAALAEMQVGQRPDESDALLASGDLVVGRRAVSAKARLWN